MINILALRKKCHIWDLWAECPKIPWKFFRDCALSESREKWAFERESRSLSTLGFFPWRDLNYLGHRRCQGQRVFNLSWGLPNKVMK